MGRERPPKKRRAGWLGSMLLAVVVIAFFAVMFIALANNKAMINAKKAERDAVKAQIEEQKAENEEMRRLLTAETDQVTEWIARDSYGYAAPNEKIYIDMSGN